MKSKLFVLLLLGGIVPVCALRSETADSLRNGKPTRSGRSWSPEPGMKPTSGICR